MNLEFWGQMTGYLDFRVGKEFGVIDSVLGLFSLTIGVNPHKG